MSDTNMTLAQRIEARRRASMIESASPQNTPSAQAPAGATPEVRAVIDALASGQNAIALARLLVACGQTGKTLSQQIGKSAAWISKTIALLKAPADVQHQIEAGTMTPAQYHEGKSERKAGAVGAVGRIDYQRTPTVTISMDAARSIALILQHIAKTHGAAPIRLAAQPTKKDLSQILNLRAHELRGLIE